MALRPFGTALVVVVVSLSVAGCGGSVSEIGFEETPADQLYNEGLALMNEGNYRAAMVKFEEVDRLHPYTSVLRGKVR